MNKKLILELDNHNVYYVKTDAVNYYITIPKNIENTNISIELKNKMGNYDMELNDELWVMENIKTTYSYIDSYNITLVIPVLQEEQISILEKIDDTKYDEIDKIIGYTINNAYTLLKEHNKKVSNEIILVNNDKYKTFINWFTAKYATSYKKLETPVMNFVVGSYNTEVEAPKVEQKEIPIIEETPKVPQVSYGYATYWILAVVTLIVSGIVAIIAFTFN